MKYACAACAKKLSGAEVMEYVTPGAEGGYCTKGGHFYCQNESCFEPLSMSSRGKDDSRNEVWFVCTSCGSKNLYATKGQAEPNFIYRTDLPGASKKA